MRSHSGYPLLLMFFLACTSFELWAQETSTITLPPRENMKVLDFFGEGGPSTAVLVSLEETTLLGPQSSYYLYAADEYHGPFHSVVDVRVSPSGEKFAVVFQKADDNKLYLTYQGVEYLVPVSGAYSNSVDNYWADPSMLGFIGDSFYLADLNEKKIGDYYFTDLILENKLIPNINIGGGQF